MSLLILAVGCALMLAGVALSALALFVAKTSAQAGERQRQAHETRLEAVVELVRGQVDGLSAVVRDLEVRPAIPFLPAPPRASFNLAKRSQALRMHRHGQRLDQIAATLELPLQEVELLLKVHQVVIGTL